jgi:hypothetical protein
LIKIYKPIVSDSFDFNGYFTQEADNEEEEVNGIMKHNEVRACVNVYVGVMKQFDELKANLDYMNNSLAYIGIGKVSLQLGYKDSITNKEDFSIEIKKRAWTHLFNKMNLEKFVTTGVQKDLNKFVETQQQIPFTMRNIYKMFEVIVGTRKDTFNRALEEVIDNFTRYTHENRFEVEGWKTNLGYMLNKKFIINYACDTDYKNHVNIKNNSRQNQMEDLTKVICSIEGEDFNNISHFNTWNLKKLNGLLNENDNRQIRGYEQKLQYSTWYSYGFFDVKFFKKGTAHFKFKDLDVWYRLNQTYSSIKGFVLSDKYKK